MTTSRSAEPTLRTVNTAAVISAAMTDYLLAAGTDKAPATRAPAHMAAWLERRGYRVVRSPALRPVERDELDQLARLVGLIDWHRIPADCDVRRSIVAQVIAAAAAVVDTPRVAC
jgi:hypothetical protein